MRDGEEEDRGGGGRRKEADVDGDDQPISPRQQGTGADLSVSGPFLAMIIFSLPRPPTGALSVPVVNWRNSPFCSTPNTCTVSQKSLQASEIQNSIKNVFPYLLVKAKTKQCYGVMTGNA